MLLFLSLPIECQMENEALREDIVGHDCEVSFDTATPMRRDEIASMERQCIELVKNGVLDYVLGVPSQKLYF